MNNKQAVINDLEPTININYHKRNINKEYRFRVQSAVYVLKQIKRRFPSK